MAPSRRAILQWAGAAPLLAQVSKDDRVVQWRKALDLPRSECFGLSGEGRGRDAASLYRVDTGGGAPLSFDISNNQILCSLDRYGALARVCVNQAVVPLPVSAMSGGIFSSKLHLRGGPWKFLVGGEQSAVQVSLLGLTVPEFSWETESLAVRQVCFAPVDLADSSRNPRAILVVFLIENRGAEARTVSVAAPEGAFSLGSSDVRVAAGSAGVWEFAVMLGSSPEETRRLQAKSPLEWFRDTMTVRRERYGDVRIAEPYFAESLVRSAESCRQSFLRLPDGSFGGGFMGSDIDARDSNWTKDTYYALLGASLSEPKFCADAIPFYLRYGLPPRPIARGLARFPDGQRVTQSLSIALAPLALASVYYRMTGDGDYFKGMREFLPKVTALSEEVLATRRGEAFLFPSMFISNGDARGHVHTGSNIVAWFAFEGLARIAGEVFGDRRLQEQWAMLAKRVRSGILEYCAGPGPLGHQFYEGVYDDRTYVPGHDGEESDTTLAPFYGFCRADDPALIRHAKVALSPANPYYAPGIDGIWWHNHGGFRPATAPAWATGLASAANLEEMEARLHRFRELTDLDGSLWWWPYKYGEKDRRAVLRGNGATKCSWAAALYLLRMVNDVLGISVDVPSARLRFAPMMPWNEFTWSRSRLGSASFDFSYRQGIEASVTNRNQRPFTVTFCEAVETTRVVGPGESVSFRLASQPGV